MAYPQSGKVPDSRQPSVYVNDKIKAFTILVLDEDGQKLGEMSRDKALELASTAGMDLVQLSYDRDKKVSTAKIVDMGKYFYDKKKKDKEKKKQQKTQSKGTKELKVSYNTGEHDVELKVKKAKELLQEGYNIKFVVQLRGRARMYPEKAIDRLQAIVVSMEGVGKAQFLLPKEDKYGYYVTLSPAK